MSQHPTTRRIDPKWGYIIFERCYLMSIRKTLNNMKFQQEVVMIQSTAFIAMGRQHRNGLTGVAPEGGLAEFR